MFVLCIIGMGCIAAFFCVCGLIEEILTHRHNKKHTETQPVVETPEQLYHKCCYCANFKKCAKGLEEVVICKEYLQ